MAVSLAEAAVASQNDLQRGVIETFVQESTILDRIPLLEIEGNAYAYNKEATLPGVAFRAVNNAYVESTGTVVQATETLAILGGDADVDRFIQQTRSNLNDQRAIQTALKVKAAVRKYQDTFFNGDVGVDANAFDGLKKRLTGSSVIDAATDGLPVIGTTSADRQAFLDKLDELIALVNPDALYMNKAIRGKILSALRRENQYVEPVGEKRDPSYQGVPLLHAGLIGSPVGSQTEILPQNETQGSATTQCSSIYAVKFGQDESDGGVTGLTNGGVQVDDLGMIHEKPALRTRVEFYCGMATFAGTAAGRLRGVKNA
jgi:hypothetical protein